YQVYLHADDHDRLRTIFGEIESEAKALLDRELERLNRGAAPPLGRLLAPFTKGREKKEGEPAMRYVAAEGRWFVHFQEDPNGQLEPGDIQVVSEFAQAPSTG